MRLKLRQIIFLAACVFSAGVFQAVQAQGAKPLAQMPKVDLSRLPRLILKPLSNEEKLKIVNEQLAKSKLPAAKSIAFGSAVKLSVDNLNFNNQATLDIWHAVILGKAGYAFFRAGENGYLEFYLEPGVAAGRQFFDCSVGAADFQTGGINFVITAGKDDALKKQTEIGVPSGQAQHLSFVIDFSGTANNKVRISAGDYFWNFKGCEITPIQ